MHYAMTLAEVGRKLRITPSQVRHIELTALAKIRRRMNSPALQDFRDAVLILTANRDCAFHREVVRPDLRDLVNIPNPSHLRINVFPSVERKDEQHG